MFSNSTSYIPPSLPQPPDAVFEVTLPRVPMAKFWKSVGPNESPSANELQRLFDKQVDNGQAYAKRLAELKSEGKDFRLTEGHVYEIQDVNDLRQVPVVLQVREGTITWYFVAPHDETHQKFRDEVFRSAGIAHLKTKNACEKYLRGTNSLHVKKMHTNEDESGFNHNHYRMQEGHDVTPEDLREHLMGFVDAEQNLKLFVEEGDSKIEKFLTKEEAEAILKEFEAYWKKVNHEGPEKTEVIEGRSPLALPERKISILKQYKDEQQKALTPEDKQEWEEYSPEQEPCKTEQNLALPFEEIAALANKSMRGLRSERAHLRQLEGSKFRVIQANYQMDDKIENVKVAQAKAPANSSIQT